ncbi:PREDICTED: ATP synthase F(0) complex subunit C2, mitochondrial-like [Elephantulus edwardii]|uniref:ATP synthase F(0) complex subunit C2, mitochondrial-like n=1 Tax=Elephantulus edwardii TaxID=28737 RepID=UPI0003F08CE8|nr:PREDICTED: ATP synthase F(0) complex subunit C2, mitochondrial-like [Elephantulus edwardii]
MFACPKLVSTPSLLNSASQLLSHRPLSAVVLKQPETLADENFSCLRAPCSLISIIPSHSFQTWTISRDRGSAAKFLGAGAATVGVAGSGAVLGSLITGCGRNPSLKQLFFSCDIVDFALSKAMGLFCLMVAFPILVAM